MSKSLAAYTKARIETEEFKESKKDYLRDFVRALPKEQTDKFIKARKEIDKASEEEFKKYPKLIDTFTLEDGKLKIENEEYLIFFVLTIFKNINIKKLF